MDRTEKRDMVASLSEGIGKASNAFLIDFTGITVPQVTELRDKIRATESEYIVVKNSLALLAIKDSPLVDLSEKFAGPTAIAYNSSDAVVLAKALKTFSKDVPALQFKGGLLDGQIVSSEQIKEIADLPSREELVSKLLFLLQSPIRNLVTVLNANVKNIAVVLDQIAAKKSENE